MAYIRVKKISGNEYAYLVESLQTSSGTRQKVKQYLGKVHAFDQEFSEEILSSVEFVGLKSKKAFLHSLLVPFFEACQFEQKEGELVFGNLFFCPKQFSLKKKTKTGVEKEAILKVKGGFLSSFTLQRLLQFKKGKDLEKDAALLAKYFLEAGIPISQEHFIAYYQLL